MTADAVRTRPSRVSWLDAAIAAFLFSLGLVVLLSGADAQGAGDPRDAFGVILMMTQTLPLAWRQRAPRVVLAITLVSWMTDVGMNYRSLPTALGLVIAVHAVAAYLPARQAFRWGIATFATSVVWTGVGILVSDRVTWAELTAVALFVVLPFGIGRADAISRERITALQVAHRAAERAHAEATEAAIRTERARIARELHDVVAHEITVMTLQAEGARRALGGANPTVSTALHTISDSGRKGLAEMHRMIGVLRDSTETPEGEAAVGTSHTPAGVAHLDPMPALASLPALAKQVEDAGLPVDLEVIGDAHVPAGVELSAYRIAQESLTNALKHAGPGARASVVVRREARAVTVCVEDDGRGAMADETTASGGHGLTGMRERVLALGGSIDFGPRPGGGFRVRAVLPSHDDTVAPKRRSHGPRESILDLASRAEAATLTPVRDES